MSKLFLKRRRPSVKEGMDNLPLGVAFARENGIVTLCNHTMHRLSYMLRGEQLQNAELFWESVVSHGEATKDGAHILRFEGGGIWLLSRRRRRMKRGFMIELSASDVTERMRLVDSIEENNRRLEALGEHLRRHSQNALELARERELLERKEHTHDELGKLLSATRHYLAGGDVDPSALWHRWHINAALMLEESRRPEGDEPLRSLYDTAAALGVALEISGEVRSGLAEDMMLAAGGECLTNILRHTDGDRLDIRIENKDGADVIYFTDNGGPLEKEITEGGGLSAIRRRIEDAGGEMQILSKPIYQLVLNIPVEADEVRVYEGLYGR